MASPLLRLVWHILLQVGRSVLSLFILVPPPVFPHHQDFQLNKPGLSLVAGSMISGRVSDFHLRVYTQRNPGTAPNPERRLRLQIPGIVLSIIGVLLFGWFCEFHIHVAGIITANSIGIFCTSINLSCFLSSWTFFILVPASPFFSF